MTIRGTVPQRVSSDLILLNVAGECLGCATCTPWTRSPFAPKEPRIVQLLAEPTHAKWQTAQASRANTRVYLRSNVVLGSATRCWCFGSSSRNTSARLTFKIEGSKQMNGVQVYGAGIQGDGQGPVSVDLLRCRRSAASGRILGRAGHRPHPPDGILAAVRLPTPRACRCNYAPDEKLNRSCCRDGVTHLRDPRARHRHHGMGSTALCHAPQASKSRRRTRIRATRQLT